MAQPRIKRYALVPDGSTGRVRSFHLARVAPASRSALGVDRLERMEDVAALERRGADGLGVHGLKVDRRPSSS